MHHTNSTHRISRALATLLSIAVLILSTACSVFGVESVEEAPYKSVSNSEPYEIRDYAPLVVVETSVKADRKKAGNQAFGKLFDYISGENEAREKISMTAPVVAESDKASSGEKIEMTAPVTYQKEGEAWRYRFVLPESFTIENAPQPLSPEVSLAEVPAKRVATIRYSGRATTEAQVKNAEKLINWIESQGLEPLSEARWAGYNAPWTLPPFRRNEVLIDISVQ